MKSDFRQAKWTVDDDGKIVCSDQCPNYRLATIEVDGAAKQSRLCRCNSHYKDAPYRIDKDCGRAFTAQETAEMETDANVRRLNDLAGSVPKAIFDKALRGLVAMWHATKKRAMTKADLFALAGETETTTEAAAPTNEAEWLTRKEAMAKHRIGSDRLHALVTEGQFESTGEGRARLYRKLA